MSDTCIGTISAGAIFEPLVGDVNRRGIPIGGIVELTNRCNLKCVHCYIRPSEDDASRGPKELSTDQWKSILGQAIDCGCLFLTLTGGEILVRPDFLHIYRYVKSKGTIVNLFTNGTKITERLAAELSDWPPKVIEITLYGMTERTYELMTQVPGSYKDCMKGIELLLQYKLPVQLKTIITTLNQHELQAMKNFAEKLGVRFRYDAEINKRLDKRGHPERLRLSPEHIVRLDREEAARWAEFKELFELRLNPPGYNSADSIYFCKAGTTTFHIDCRGYISPCIISRYELCSLSDVDFAEAWYHFIPSVRNIRRTKQSDCDYCDVAHACNQCPGWATLESGDPEEPVPFLCRITRLRQEAIQCASDSDAVIRDET
jgi:radical SAM protein with 4Fe4S-binding SPASM domain